MYDFNKKSYAIIKSWKGKGFVKTFEGMIYVFRIDCKRKIYFESFDFMSEAFCQKEIQENFQIIEIMTCTILVKFSML